MEIDRADAGNQSPGLVRRLGLFDATMIVMGGIVGSGIFMNPYVVARQVHSPALILGVWVLGGFLALFGAFIYAELSARRPQVGGQYAYIREAYHPLLSFSYGWALLLVTQTGGMAAVAVTFARYFADFTHTAMPEWLIAAGALALLTVINCLGVRAGSTTQSALMVMKIVAIAALILCGFFLAGKPAGSPSFAGPLLDRPVSFNLFTAVGAAMVPVLFAYGGWQTACFIAGEVRDPRKNMPRGLIIGVLGVILLYLGVNFVCVSVLGTEGLAATTLPATDVMRAALGENGSRLIAAGIAISTLGFLSQSMLTAPRVYYAMAEDGLFFRSVGWIHPRSRVPVVAIALQGACAAVIAWSGRYEQILNYVVSVDFIFFGLSATCIFGLRRNDAKNGNSDAGVYHAPGHPWTTLIFVAVSWLVVLNTIYQYPANTVIGLAIMLAGVPVYYFWNRRRTSRPCIRES
jgi:basic amino acid/polyamine antiporter, APA family